LTFESIPGSFPRIIAALEGRLHLQVDVWHAGGKRDGDLFCGVFGVQALTLPTLLVLPGDLCSLLME